MPLTLTSADYEEIAKRVVGMLLKEKEPSADWVPLSEIRKYTPNNKSAEWIKLYILKAFPETRDWSTDPYPGRGKSVEVLESKAKDWIINHNREIDWNQQLPK